MLEYGCAMLGVRMKRYSLKQIHDTAQLDEKSGKLMIEGDEVALVYFRAGYTPNDYPTNDEWRARVKLETSNAIKCPTLALQLAGLKKVQQVLSSDDAMQRFVKDATLRTQMQSVYAGLWSLGDEHDDAIVTQAIADHCRHYVVKPQREGGGNNHYDEDAVALLQQSTREQRRAYILMSRIIHPTHKWLLLLIYYFEIYF